MNLKINPLFLFFGYGIVCFPLLLLIGPLFSELFLISVVIFSLFFIIKEKKEIFYKNKFFIFFLLFYISTIYSTLLNYYNLDLSISGIFYFRVLLFSFSIWFVLENLDIFNKKTIFFYNLFFLLIIFDSLLQFYSGKNLLNYEIIRSRISGFFGEELILGSFILRILPIFLLFLVMCNNLSTNKKNIYYATIISLACYVIYLTGERTSFGLLILYFFTLFFMSSHLRKFISIITIIFLTLTVTLQNFKNSNQINPAHRIFVKSYNQIIGKGDGAEKHEEFKKKIFDKIYIFSHDHQGHYMLSYKIFRDHMISGTGPKGFRYLCRNKIYILENNDGCSTHPHNTYIQILVSNGLIGFFLLIFAFLYTSKEIFLCRKKMKDEVIYNKKEICKAILISAIFINLWPLIPSGNFFNNWLSMLYFYPIGFYLYFKHQNDQKIN